MVNEQALADGSAGVDLDAGAAAAMLADPPGEEEPLVLVQPVCNAVVHQNVKARVQQNDLQHAARGGVLALDVPCVVQQTHGDVLSFLMPVPETQANSPDLIIIAQQVWNVQ